MTADGPELFKTTVPEAELHAVYRHLRDDPSCAPVRAYLESLWTRYAPHADRHFATEFQRHLPKRAWEMRLSCVLEKAGCVVSSANAGPDVRAVLGARTMWFEAVTPSRGVGPYQVPDRQIGTVPDHEIVTRYFYAIQDKVTARRKLRKSGPWLQLQPTDPFVIAVSGAEIPLAELERNGHPRILNVLFALGDPIILVPLKGGDPMSGGYTKRESIGRESDRDPIRYDLFLSPDFADVSAILFSPHHVKNWPAMSGEHEANDFIIVHNPHARAPLTVGRLDGLRVGREYWVEDGHLHWHDWRQRRPRRAWESCTDYVAQRAMSLRCRPRGAPNPVKVAAQETVAIVRVRGRFAKVMRLRGADGEIDFREGWIPKKYLRPAPPNAGDP